MLVERPAATQAASASVITCNAVIGDHPGVTFGISRVDNAKPGQKISKKRVPAPLQALGAPAAPGAVRIEVSDDGRGNPGHQR